MMQLRETPDWFNKSSESVLIVLYRAGIPVNATSILYSLEVAQPGDHGSEMTIREAIERFVNKGWVNELKHPSRGTTLFEITEKGEQWMEQNYAVNQ